MRKKILTSILAATVIGATAIAGTSLIQASGDNVTDSKYTSNDTLPANLKYDSDHPDEIYVKDHGVFVKVDSNKIDYNKKEVVYDVQKVTDNTSVIVAYDETYLKKSDWK
ncbi:hypothetical protein [Paenibacillus pabuli]|nr:hypothetical protein [Paenibacillus pabuli]MEC0127155.1 hypothetical protein [Paenibacillus pabuli]